MKTAAGTAIVRRMVRIRVRIQAAVPGEEPTSQVTGIMSIAIGDADLLPVRFRATVNTYTHQVLDFAPRRPISGAGAEQVTAFYKAALQEVLDTAGARLLGTEPVESPEARVASRWVKQESR
jgi:hypothetical protein